MTASYRQSPNYSEGRNGTTIDRLVIHWMVGNLAGADNRFLNPAADVATNYGVENGTVYQWVDEADTAWGAGDWAMNVRCISIEHSAGPDRPASDATYETSAQLIAGIFKRHPAITPDRVHVIRHGEVVPTQCCGTVSPERLIARALEIKGSTTPLVPVPTPKPSPIPAQYNVIAWSGDVTVTATDLMVRSAATTNAAGGKANTSDGNLHSGDVFRAAGYTHAQDPYGDGRDIWLKTIRGNWVWSGGTNFNLKPGPKPFNRLMTVTIPILNVRTGPSSAFPGKVANTADGMLHQGAQVQVIAQIEGETVGGVSTWYQSWRGNWMWGGGLK